MQVFYGGLYLTAPVRDPNTLVTPVATPRPATAAVALLSKPPNPEPNPELPL